VVHKKFLRVEQMLTTVEQAQSWTDFLIRSEARATGDTDNAMDRVARRYGVPRSTLWGLRYRPPVRDSLRKAAERLNQRAETGR